MRAKPVCRFLVRDLEYLGNLNNKIKKEVKTHFGFVAVTGVAGTNVAAATGGAV